MRLKASHLSRRAGGHPIVSDVSLSTEPGEFLAIVGPNGSGKTTLLSMLAGLLEPHSGHVMLDGKPIGRMRRRAVAQRIAFVEQQAETAEALKARQVVELGRTPYLGPLRPYAMADEAIVADALEAVGMTGLADRRWHSLSGGEKQRLQLARALAQEPSIIILDEPTNHLDIRHQLELLALVGRSGFTVVAALHDLNHAALFATRIAVMDRGTLAALGPPAAILTHERIAHVFGVDAEVEIADGGPPIIRFRSPPPASIHGTGRWA